MPPKNEQAVLRPAVTAYMTDGGANAMNTSDPQSCITADSPVKPGCWILSDPSSDLAGSAQAAEISDANWGGPCPRHNARSNVLMADGHVSLLQPSHWYWAGSGWLDPAVGGE